jgi:single-strand DNA-binding protein
MSSDLGTCVIVGNLTRDPEEKYTSTGVRLCEFGVAMNRSKPLGDGTFQDIPNYFDCTVWDDQAGNVLASLRKGDRVIVQGELRWSSWEDAETGKNRSKVSVNVTNIGPALRWATVSGIERSTRSGGAAPSPSRTQQWDDGEEPF